jgi:hypothetical protein
MVETVPPPGIFGLGAVFKYSNSFILKKSIATHFRFSVGGALSKLHTWGDACRNNI